MKAILNHLKYEYGYARTSVMFTNYCRTGNFCGHLHFGWFENEREKKKLTRLQIGYLQFNN